MVIWYACVRSRPYCILVPRATQRLVGTRMPIPWSKDQQMLGVGFPQPLPSDKRGQRGQRRHPPYTPYSTGNSSRVIFRIGIKLLPRALVILINAVQTYRAKGSESVKRSRAFLNIDAKWVGAHLGKGNRWTLWQPVKSVQLEVVLTSVLLIKWELRRSIETGRLYNKASRTPRVIFVE